MEPKKNLSRHEQILRCFTYLPKRILSFHGRDNMAEFVFHSLCDEKCLNLAKAAYFVDNYDFDCMKGIAGYDRNEEYHEGAAWDNPDNFSEHMKSCLFNQEVRNISLSSFRRLQYSEKDIAQRLSEQLSLENPLFYFWDSKYDNKALLLFEPVFENGIHNDAELIQGLCFLGLCPVY